MQLGSVLEVSDESRIARLEETAKMIYPALRSAYMSSREAPC